MSLTDGSPLLQCEGLTIETPRLTIEDFSLTVSRGDWVEIVGLPGSGKSILFQLLSLRHFDPKALIYVQKKNLRHTPSAKIAALRRDMSSCAQRPVFLEEYTVSQNLLLPQIARKKKRNEQNVVIEKIAEEFGISKILDTKVRFLSQQERLFLGIVRACVGDPPLILIDSVFELLGEPYHQAVVSAMRTRHENGTAFVLFSCSKTGLRPESETIVKRLPIPPLVEDSPY